MRPLLRCGFYLLVLLLLLWLLQTDFNLSDIFFVVFLFLAGAVFLIVNLYSDINAFRKQRRFSNLLPSLICLLATLLAWALGDGTKEKNTSPIILYASHDAGVGGSWLEFRQDSSYSYTSGSPFGIESFESCYSFRDSLILLDGLPERSLLRSPVLVRRYAENHGPNLTGLSVWQADATGKVDSGRTPFIVYPVIPEGAQ